MENKSKYAFISYSSINQQIADSFRRLLLDSGIDCWMAPYDIPPGNKYASVINDALENCSCLILLLTSASQNSQFVEIELERALSYRKPIIPVQLENVELNSGFKFYIGSSQIVAVKDISLTSPEIKRVLNGIRSFTEDAKNEVIRQIPVEYTNEARQPNHELSLEKIRLRLLGDRDDLTKDEAYELLVRIAEGKKENESKSGTEKDEDIDDEDFRIEGTVLMDYYGSSNHVIIPDRVKVINNNVFKDHYEIVSVSMSDKVWKIGDGAFENCSRLRSSVLRSAEVDPSSYSKGTLYLPQSIRFIGHYAFYGCSSITALEFPNTTNLSIGVSAFKNCPKLRAFNINPVAIENNKSAFDEVWLGQL